MEELNLGQPNTNPSSGREEDLNPGPPDYNSSALITRPRRLLHAATLFVSCSGKDLRHSPIRLRNLKPEAHSENYQMFPVHTKPEKFRSVTIAGHFGFVFEENFGQGNHVIFMTSSFSRSSVFKNFSVHTKTQNPCFSIPPV